MAEKKNLCDLVAMDDPDCVWREAAHLLRLMSASADLKPAEAAFRDVRALFAGRYPGYRACNTQYHDLQHTTDTLLAMLRLAHGAFVEGERFEDRELVLAAVCAMLHDTGYIQEDNDTEGTGAKHTACHVDRSIAFMRAYFRGRGLPAGLAEAGASVLRCTGLNVKLGSIAFESPRVELLGKMLGAGDLLGQMADRCYLERLLLLFCEFREGKVPGFQDERDLLQKTVGFYDVTRKRLAGELGGVDRLMRPHFRARWGIDADLYAEAVSRHIAYLKEILEKHPDDFMKHLRRGGFVARLRRLREHRGIP